MTNNLNAVFWLVMAGGAIAGLLHGWFNRRQHGRINDGVLHRSLALLVALLAIDLVSMVFKLVDIHGLEWLSAIGIALVLWSQIQTYRSHRLRDS